jgi:hypothetical protein
MIGSTTGASPRAGCGGKVAAGLIGAVVLAAAVAILLQMRSARDTAGYLELSRGNPEAALRLWDELPENDERAIGRALLRAHLAGEPTDSALDAFRDSMALERDPESLYQGGLLLVSVGAVDQGLDLVRRAIEGDACSASGLSDSIWTPYRDLPAYRDLLLLGRECSDRSPRRDR